MLKYRNIYLGNNCNNNCLYCEYKKHPAVNYDLNTVYTALEHEQPADNILLYGGEPSIRLDLPQIIQKAVSSGAKRIKILTNGRAFANINTLYRIIQAGCLLFEIKLWGPEPYLHDKLTRTPNSFQDTVTGLENLASLPDKFVCVRIPVCRENYASLESTVATALNFGANRIILSCQDAGLSFQDIVPHIKNAINISVFNRTWILTQGMPFCMMQGLEQHIEEIYSALDNQYDKSFLHHNNCMNCIFRTICPGINPEYINQFGWREFSPVVASKYHQDIIRLYEQ